MPKRKASMTSTPNNLFSFWTKVLSRRVTACLPCHWGFASERQAQLRTWGVAWRLLVAAARLLGRGLPARHVGQPRRVAPTAALAAAAAVAGAHLERFLSPALLLR
jgi:hypothetical protein